MVFVPFHYGYWDVSDVEGYWDVSDVEGYEDVSEAEHQRAANELTITDWDPVSKQHIFKTAAVRVSRVGGGDGNAAPAPTNTAPCGEFPG